MVAVVLIGSLTILVLLPAIAALAIGIRLLRRVAPQDLPALLGEQEGPRAPSPDGVDDPPVTPPWRP